MPGSPSVRSLIIIPALNEQDALPAVLRDLREHAPDFDVLVVDDGSTDATSQVAAAHGAAVARLPFNLGVGAALRTGFLYAVRHGYDRAVQFDADGQHDAREIDVLVDALARGADLVVGTRFGGGDASYEVSRMRGGAMRLLRLGVAALAGRRFTDTSSGFRGFSRPILEYFSRSYPAEYLGDSVEALLLACYAGFDVVEVPATMRARQAGAPSHRSFKLAYHYLRLLLVMVVTAPGGHFRRRAIA